MCILLCRESLCQREKDAKERMGRKQQYIVIKREHSCNSYRVPNPTPLLTQSLTPVLLALLCRLARQDGKDALPGAVECLEELRRQGKRLVVLSNTSKREAFTMDRLPKFGFRRDLFDGGVTSGEVRLTRRSLSLKLLECIVYAGNSV